MSVLATPPRRRQRVVKQAWHHHYVPTYSIDVSQDVLDLLTRLPDVLLVAVMGRRGFVQTIQQQRVPDTTRTEDRVVSDRNTT